MSISLNVGGTLFTTTLDTLNKSGYFSTMFSGAWKERLNETIFIDRSPKGFQHVLDFLRDPQYEVPARYKYELEFYKVNYEDNNIERKCNDPVSGQPRLRLPPGLIAYSCSGDPAWAVGATSIRSRKSMY